MEQDKKDHPEWMNDEAHDELTNGRGGDNE